MQWFNCKISLLSPDWSTIYCKLFHVIWWIESHLWILKFCRSYLVVKFSFLRCFLPVGFLMTQFHLTWGAVYGEPFWILISWVSHLCQILVKFIWSVTFSNIYLYQSSYFYLNFLYCAVCMDFNSQLQWANFKNPHQLLPVT